MKRQLVVTIIIILICVTSIIININKTKTATKAIETVTQRNNYKYEIKDYKGRIAVYVYGKELPIEIFEIYTDSLPNKDSDMIKNGINISNEKELQQKIEELTG